MPLVYFLTNDNNTVFNAMSVPSTENICTTDRFHLQRFKLRFFFNRSVTRIVLFRMNRIHKFEFCISPIDRGTIAPPQLRFLRYYYLIFMESKFSILIHLQIGLNKISIKHKYKIKNIRKTQIKIYL